MFCTACNKDLSECDCSDIEERLEGLRNAKSFIYKMCRICKKHYKRCKCEEPDWTTSHDGVELENVEPCRTIVPFISNN